MIFLLETESEKQRALSLGIPNTNSSLFFEWSEGERSVYFAINARGDALECHLAAEGRSKLALREAVNQMVDFCFAVFPDAQKIVSYSYKNSMKNLTRKCGFKLIATIPASDCDDADDNKIEILMRFKNGKK